MKEYFIEIKWRIIGIVGRIIINLLFSTVKIRSLDFDKAKAHLHPKKFIAAIWHSRIIAFSHIYRDKYDAGILVSRSNDGEYVARILARQGFTPVRGSSSKGGLRALARLIKLLKTGRPGVIIPDGPRGPGFKLQPGIITLAMKTGYPILPMTFSAKPARIFNSWDRFMLPYPFSKCIVVYGEPLYVPETLGSEAFKRVSNKLEKELNRITDLADRSVGYNENNIKKIISYEN